MKIGVVGHSSNHINEQQGSERLLENLNKIIGRSIDPSSVEIVTGLTNIGIPKLAYQIADQTDYFKVGISAQQALTVKCGIYPVDKQVIKGDKFGDESDVFIDYIDYLIRVGGGKQSHHEVELFKLKCQENHWPLAQRLFESPLKLEN